MWPLQILNLGPHLCCCERRNMVHGVNPKLRLFRASGSTKYTSFIDIDIGIKELIIKTHLSITIRLLRQLSKTISLCNIFWDTVMVCLDLKMLKHSSSVKLLTQEGQARGFPFIRAPSWCTCPWPAAVSSTIPSSAPPPSSYRCGTFLETHLLVKRKPLLHLVRVSHFEL